MKKLFSTVCITLCLLFSSAATAIWADDGNGHAPGYVCVETTTAPADCLPNDPPPQQQQSETSGSNDEEATDTSLTLLELIIALLP
jgi:hypothetical protein